MRDIVLKKQLGDGRLVEVEVQEYAIGRYRCLVYLAGRWVDGPPEPQPLPMPRSNLTHYLGGAAGGPLVGLTQAEAMEISTELSQRKAAAGSVLNQPGIKEAGYSHPLHRAA